MPFTLLEGTFRPNADLPDGDSVAFAPDDPAPLFTLPRCGTPPRVCGDGTVRPRLEGIDALEAGAFASDAIARHLEWIGTSTDAGAARGYLLTNRIGPRGRPIAFAFAGEPEDEDGASVFLDVELLRESVNHKLLEAGVVYPLFYDTLFGDLRAALARAAAGARAHGRGLWPADRTREGVTWGGRGSLPELAPIFPKLRRRLEEYTRDRDFRRDSADLASFTDFLFATRERLFLLSESKFTGLDNVVEVDGDRVLLAKRPEDMVFLS